MDYRIPDTAKEVEEPVFKDVISHLANYRMRNWNCYVYYVRCSNEIIGYYDDKLHKYYLERPCFSTQ